MRWYQRKTFFFNDTDNSVVPPYVNGLFYTQGATVQVTVSGTIYAMVALNAGVAQTAGAPSWATVQFTPPAQSSPPTQAFPPPPIGTPGTTVDNTGPLQIIWANNGPYQPGSTTGFSTVYQINQLQMPIDLIKINLIEVTWQGNIRIPMQEVSYDLLRSWDTIRPFAPDTYPSWYAWYQQQVYLWPYPAGLFPVTLSYRSAPPIAVTPQTSNYWTTQFEAGIRYYAEGLLLKNLIHDSDAADHCFGLSQIEFLQLQSQQISQGDQQGTPPSEW